MAEEPRRLTVQDPVDPDTLAKFSALDTARYEIGDQFLELEQEKIRLLAAAHQIDTQKKRLFERVLVERGIEPTAKVSIEPKTGEISVLQPRS